MNSVKEINVKNCMCFFLMTWLLWKILTEIKWKVNFILTCYVGFMPQKL